jgi:hypothetical protein
LIFEKEELWDSNMAFPTSKKEKKKGNSRVASILGLLVELGAL